MPQKTRNELKELFKTGAKPSGDDFKAFIDSTLNTTDDGIAKASGADTSLKINAQGTDEKLLDFYTGETKTWSINQKPADDKSGLNIATPGGSKLFIDSSSGNVGVGTTSPGAKLEINGDLKLQSGVGVNEFSIDGTLAGNSDLAIPTEKAVKSYADTKALLAGSSSQSFSANNLTVNGNVGIGTTSPGAKLEINGDLKLQSGVGVNEFSIDGTLAGNSDLAIPTEKAVKSYADTKALLAGSSSQSFSANNLTVNGNVGIGTTSPGAKLQINGDLKLQSGVGVNEFSIDGTLAGNSDLAIPTEKAVRTYVKSYADTKALLAGSSSQSFSANNLTVNRITSPMWKVTEVLDNKVGPLPITVTYQSGGGTLVIWFAGTFCFPSDDYSASLTYSLFIDNVERGTSFVHSYRESTFTPFTMPTQVITRIAAGNHELKFTMSHPGRFSNDDCHFYATVMELPF